MIYDSGKVTRPAFETKYELDDEEYGELLRNIIYSKTSNRKHFNRTFDVCCGLIVIGKKVVPLDYLRDYSGDIVKFLKDVEIDEFEGQPVWHGYALKIPKLKNGKTYVLYSRKSIRLITRKTVPPNAFLISADPPVWLQVCRGALLVTRGMLWCPDFTIGEYHDEFVTITRDGDGWFLRVSRELMNNSPNYKMEFPAGIYRIEGSTFKHVSKQSADAITAFRNSELFVKDGHYYLRTSTVSEIELIPITETELRLVEVPGKKFYVPKYYLRRRNP